MFKFDINLVSIGEVRNEDGRRLKEMKKNKQTQKHKCIFISCRFESTLFFTFLHAIKINESKSPRFVSMYQLYVCTLLYFTFYPSQQQQQQKQNNNKYKLQPVAGLQLQHGLSNEFVSFISYFLYQFQYNIPRTMR